MSFTIYCVGRNYADHIRELGNTPFDQPAIFMKPCSSLVTNGRIVIPPFTNSLHHETELIIRLKKRRLRSQ
ncbi:MAG: fumarylacetoacetate hydrolase family protein [Acetobacteraceae bacterium]